MEISRRPMPAALHHVALRHAALATLLLMGAWLLTPLEQAHAHGGQYQPPLPPKPGPTPPPPPPPPPPIKPLPSTPPTGGPDDTGNPMPDPTTGRPTVDGRPTRPTTPTTDDWPGPVAPVPTTPDGAGAGESPAPGPPGSPGNEGDLGGRTRGKSSAAPSSTSLHSWQTWWRLHRWQYMPDRKTMLERRQSIDGPITGGTDDRLDPLRTWEERRATLTDSATIPALLAILDPKARSRQETLAAALLALGKVAHDPAHVRLILRYLQHAEGALVTRESAALAVGLLRRTNKDLQHDAKTYDQCRAHLIQAIRDSRAPTRTRSFAALSLGLLGNQPTAYAIGVDGRLITRLLWRFLAAEHASEDLPAALLTALGMQPAAGVPDGVRQELQQIVLGRRVFSRKWSDNLRSHALTARLRIDGGACVPLLMRVLSTRRIPTAVRRAAFLGLSARSASLSPSERAAAAKVWSKGIKRARDPLTRGLAWLAAARLLRAGLADDRADLFADGDLDDRLLAEAEHGANPVRGFAVLGVGIVRSQATRASGRPVSEFRTHADRILLEGVTRRRGDDGIVSAYVVALGIVRARSAVPVLTETLVDRGRDPALRGHAALALAQIGDQDPPVIKAMQAALLDRNRVELRGECALALGLLGGRKHAYLLSQGFKRGHDSQYAQAHTAMALGRLGDLRNLPLLMRSAANKKLRDETRAVSVAAAGLLSDPEEIPTLSLLRFDANYPAATPALREALDIL